MKRPSAIRAAILAILLSAAIARAHEVGLSRGEYLLDGDAVKVSITFARREVINLVAGLDADHDGALTASEVEASRDAIAGAIAGRIKVRGDGAACPGKLEGASLAEEDGLTVRARYTCAAPPREVAIDLSLLEDLPFGHRHVARSGTAAGTTDSILSQRSRSISIAAPAGAQATARRDPEVAAEGGRSPIALGLERAITGYAQIVFLIALVLPAARIRAQLSSLAAFAAGTAIGIALAALGLWAPSPRVVAPAIALSIAYVGADDLFTDRHDRRWPIALAFGSVHGFAIAPAIASTAASGAAIALFGLGAICGEVAVMAILLVGMSHARKHDAFRERGVKALSAALVVAGLILFARDLAAC